MQMKHPSAFGTWREYWDMDYGKFVFRDFSANQNIKNIVYFAI